jgi:hypothetical protein
MSGLQLGQILVILCAEIAAVRGRLTVAPVRKTYTPEQLMEEVTAEAMRATWDSSDDLRRERVEE